MRREPFRTVSEVGGEIRPFLPARRAPCLPLGARPLLAAKKPAAKKVAKTAVVLRPLAGGSAGFFSVETLRFSSSRWPEGETVGYEAGLTAERP